MEVTGAAAARIGLSLLIGYLAANALGGNQGLISYIGLEAQARALAAERNLQEEEIAALRAQIGRLRIDGADGLNGIDKDYLAERARALLNAKLPGEVDLALGLHISDLSDQP
jgi:cell division protein FtsB